MKLRSTVALACLITLIWSQTINCDQVSNTSDVSKWRCTCSAALQGNNSFATESNCSRSCDCSPGSTTNQWTCICCNNEFPEVVAGNLTRNCFTACNCVSGEPSLVHSSKKRISSKAVIIILLISVLLTILALLASVACYVCRRDNYSIKRGLFSFDKETSFNSGTNLISHRASPVSDSKFYISSPTNSIARCIHKTSFLFRDKKETVLGTITRFSYPVLEDATNKFSDSNLIGVGGSSHVYRGHLRDGRIVAVKRLETQRGSDSESFFLREIELISKLHHCHVVPLLGYCSENQGKHAQRLLVFEFMSNGSLRESLDSDSGKSLDWNARIAIAIGAAKGLEYLHEAAAPKILHRDVKSTNVLLDENWRAKITDLGMAKHLRTDDAPSCTNSPARMQGTFGYFAPEYAIVGRASLKSDVFSFGVVLLELISGRQPIYKMPNRGEESLVLWAAPRLLDSRRVIQELPDPRLNGQFPEEEMQIMAYLAKECLLLDPDSRPTMSEVVQVLSTIAPERSWRQNFSVNLFQHSTAHSQYESDFERADKEQDMRKAEDLRQTESDRWSDRCSLPTSLDQTPCTTNILKATPDPIDGLTVFTSNAKGWCSQEEEAVDLTEPRLESFCVSNIIR